MAQDNDESCEEDHGKCSKTNQEVEGDDDLDSSPPRRDFEGVDDSRPSSLPRWTSSGPPTPVSMSTLLDLAGRDGAGIR